MRTNDRAAQLVERHAGHRDRLFFRERAAVDRAEEEVEQSLTRRGVVEHIAHERRLRRRSTKFRSRAPCCSIPSRKKRVYRRVTRHELRRMQVPALIEPASSEWRTSS